MNMWVFSVISIGSCPNDQLTILVGIFSKTCYVFEMETGDNCESIHFWWSRISMGFNWNIFKVEFNDNRKYRDIWSYHWIRHWRYFSWTPLKSCFIRSEWIHNYRQFPFQIRNIFLKKFLQELLFCKGKIAFKSWVIEIWMS